MSIKRIIDFFPERRITRFTYVQQDKAPAYGFREYVFVREVIFEISAYDTSSAHVVRFSFIFYVVWERVID
jgi:hypothetical protein